MIIEESEMIREVPSNSQEKTAKRKSFRFMIYG